MRAREPVGPTRASDRICTPDAGADEHPVGRLARPSYLRAMPRTVPNLILLSALAGSLAAASPASAVTFKVTSVQHSSSSSKTDLPHYQGSSSATWSLAKRTKDAPNRLSIARGGGLIFGSGTINVRGTFTASATSDTDSCSLSAPTGSEEYPAVAPLPLILAVTKDPQGRTVFAFTGVHATLGNPYFGSGCSTSLTGEPDGDTTNLTRVKPSIFRKKRFTIRIAGASTEAGITYRYSTVFKFTKVR